MSRRLYPNDPDFPRSSRWGGVQNAEELAPGIVAVDTASHGGVQLSPDRNRQVHPAWRDRGGQYEEDCQWAIVAVTFPEVYDRTFGRNAAEHAHGVARNYYPDQYEKVTGHKVTAEESYVVREREWKAAHAGKWQTVSASRSDEHPGMTVVTACIDGRTEDGQYANPTRRFLVPAEEYRASRSGPGVFVVDPDRHVMLPPAGRERSL